MDEFKKYSSVHAYLEQLLKTATKGNVTVEYALHVSRMKLTCSVCEHQLTAPEPQGTELSYDVQEFIKIHAHVGGHKDEKKWGDYVPPTAVTCDFKPVSAGYAKTVLKNLQAPPIDVKPEMAAAIAAKMEAYEKEVAIELSDEVLAAKIKALQKESAEANKTLPAGKVAPVTKEELIALQNVLMLKQLAAKKQQLLGSISGIHIAPPKPKAKPLKIATGRKFR